ncbi:MAG: anaerobic ribonucleoside-triphosphate reductase activating protein [Lachnospiraceae bacterium]|nr:anaerobic ribonucleoside-triphosphate reductase activating protein [Lachnospiraceae bacterium]
MKIYGLQKMTLLDYPQKVACTVFLGGCDFRCPFCHNFELVTGGASPVMDEEELFEFLEKRRGLLDGVVFTGGEPCLWSDLFNLIKRTKELGYLVKLDTNGYHPEPLEELLEAGLLDYVAMDIKNGIYRYKRTVGLDIIDSSKIKQSISLIMKKAPDYEFRTTVVREFHDEKSFELIGELIPGAKNYYLQAFTDRDTVPDRNLSSPTKEELEKYKKIASAYAKNVEIRGVE